MNKSVKVTISNDKARCVITIMKTISRKCMIIDDVFVDSFHRSKGNGKKLINKAIKIAKENNCDCVELVTKIPKFFNRFGFKDTGKTHMSLILNRWKKRPTQN